MQNCNEDEFEKEMEAEAVLILEQAASGFAAVTSTSKPGPPHSSEQRGLEVKEREVSADKRDKEFYSDVYFDSSSSEDEQEEG